MKLWFDSCGDGRDFAAVCDPPESLMALDPDGERGMEVWFRAYDTSVAAAYNNRDSMLHEHGIEFDCEVRIEFAEGCSGEDIYLAGFTAQNEQEAERLLQIAADALYE